MLMGATQGSVIWIGLRFKMYNLFIWQEKNN